MQRDNPSHEQILVSAGYSRGGCGFGALVKAADMPFSVTKSSRWLLRTRYTSRTAYVCVNGEWPSCSESFCLIAGILVSVLLVTHCVALGCRMGLLPRFPLFTQDITSRHLKVFISHKRMISNHKYMINIGCNCYKHGSITELKLQGELKTGKQSKSKDMGWAHE